MVRVMTINITNKCVKSVLCLVITVCVFMVWWPKLDYVNIPMCVSVRPPGLGLLILSLSPSDCRQHLVILERGCVAARSVEFVMKKTSTKNLHNDFNLKQGWGSLQSRSWQGINIWEWLNKNLWWPQKGFIQNKIYLLNPNCQMKKELS